MVGTKQGEVKNSTGNGEAKEFICTIHGHELRGRGECWQERGARRRSIKGRNNGTVIM